MEEVSDSNRSIIRPRPGVRERDRSSGSAGARAPSGGAASVTPPRGGISQRSLQLENTRMAATNPLLMAANPVITSAYLLRQTVKQADSEALFEKMKQLMIQFESDAKRLQANVNDCVTAHYLLCAFVDDSVYSTPWGMDSAWSKCTIMSYFGQQSSIHQRNLRGEDYFRIVDGLMKKAESTLPLLELAYVLLDLGFQGKYQSEGKAGEQALADIKYQVYQRIQSVKGAVDPAISPPVQVALPPPSTKKMVPVWAIGTISAALLVLMFLGFLFSLKVKMDPILLDIKSIANQISKSAASAATFAIDQISNKDAPVKAEPSIQTEKLKQYLSGIFKGELEKNRISVEIRDGYETIILQGDKYFQAGRANLTQDSTQLVMKLGQALAGLTAKWEIHGHTDNVPIRTARFLSNWDLSRARATSVSDVLTPILGEGAIYRVRALADSDSLVPNNTAANRGLNRRVEIVKLY